MARPDGSDRFIELYHFVAIVGAAATRMGPLGQARRPHRTGWRPLAAHPHLALQACRRGPVAQGIEQQPSKLKVAGSNPAGVAKLLPAPATAMVRALDGDRPARRSKRPASRSARRRTRILLEHRLPFLSLASATSGNPP